MSISSNSSSHTWRFFRSGGFDQVVISRGADLEHLSELDQKLWTVLNCPTLGLEFDAATTSLLDTDNDGQIRVPELLAAVRWCCARLVDSNLMFAEPGVPLTALKTDDAEGAALYAAAQRVLTYLDKPNDAALTVQDFLDTTKLYAADHFNGDGVVAPQLAQDPQLQQLIQDIIDCLGGVADRSGSQGVNQSLLEQFFQQAAAIVDWQRAGDADDSQLWPLGAETPAAVAALERVQTKVDDYFVRCQLAAFDERAAASLNPDTGVYGSLSNRAIATLDTELAALPLATIDAAAALPLQTGVNPAWADAIQQLLTQVVEPLLGTEPTRTHLSRADWTAVQGLLAPWQAWQAQRPASALHQLPAERLAELAQGHGQADLAALIAEDAAITSFAENVQALEKLCRYQRDLVQLLRNFVSLSDFYQRRQKAIFQAGTLFIDQRSCELVLRVADAAKHASMASFSGCYLLYCTCTRKDQAPLQIVAALTAGDVDYSMAAGRNGVFYDRQGRDWKATVTKVVSQPISVRQAFWSPYKRLAAFIETQINKFAAARDKDIDSKTSAGITQASTQASAQATAKAPAPAAKSSFDIAKFAGIFAAIGLALGAIGTALAALAAGFLALPVWQMPLVLLGVMLLISGPSMLMAAMTLRRRNLGPLLDANGWAVNTRAIINIPFGAALTGVAKLPEHSERALADPYAQPRTRWGFWLLLVVTIVFCAYVWHFGWPLGLL
ncbi:MAG: hypothetical protein R3273_01505 [Pseudidiomarina maritima]|nr:hypothetical protein [Pseudidiomarina maritima]